MAARTLALTSYPLSWLGGVEFRGGVAAEDILTLTGPVSQTGDFLVWQSSANSELGYIDAAGDIVLNKTSQTVFTKLQLPILNTAPSSAGLTKGDVWLSKATTDVYRLTLCISTVTGTVRYGSRIIRATIGTASN
jgi:hypothetical protein